MNFLFTCSSFRIDLLYSIFMIYFIEIKKKRNMQSLQNFANMRNENTFYMFLTKNKIKIEIKLNLNLK